MKRVDRIPICEYEYIRYSMINISDNLLMIIMRIYDFGDPNIDFIN